MSGLKFKKKVQEEKPTEEPLPGTDKRGDKRGVPPVGYQIGSRVERGMDRYFSLFDNASQWTGLTGAFLPAHAAARKHRMARATMIRVVWPQVGMRDAEEAKVWGWWPAPEVSPPPSAPHFAIDQNGKVVQFLDPGLNGSDFMEDADLARVYPPTQTIVIAAMSPYWYPALKATEAQLKSLERLLDMLATAFLRPRVEKYGPWAKAVEA